jgi:hypothetical protein
VTEIEVEPRPNYDALDDIPVRQRTA